jgi:aspartate aminotransferase-like enzyme
MATNRNILLTPGPAPVPPESLRVMAEPIFHHRTPQYQKIFREVSENLKPVFRTAQPVYTFTGSGTLAMETSMINFLSPGDKIISIEAGKFGERWSSIAKQYQFNVVKLQAPYGEIVTPEQVAEALKQNPDVKAVYGTLCETSTAVLFDIKKIAEVVAKTPAIFVVDAISGLAADRLEMDAWQVDVVVSGSQKALMCPPGLAFLAVSEKAWKLNANAKCPRFYMDLARYKKSLAEWDTPFTSAIGLVLALRESLQLIHNAGIETVWSRTHELAGKTRKMLTNLGLEFFTNHFSNTLTSVKVPQGVDGKKLVSIMRDQKGVTMAGGQGDMAGKIFRIAHFGYISEDDIKIGVSVLKETIEELRRGASKT